MQLDIHNSFYHVCDKKIHPVRLYGWTFDNPGTRVIEKLGLVQTNDDDKKFLSRMLIKIATEKGG